MKDLCLRVTARNGLGCLICTIFARERSYKLCSASRRSSRTIYLLKISLCVLHSFRFCQLLTSQPLRSFGMEYMVTRLVLIRHKRAFCFADCDCLGRQERQIPSRKGHRLCSIFAVAVVAIYCCNQPISTTKSHNQSVRLCLTIKLTRS